MPPVHFSRYILRTTDVEAAGAFYDAVLGRREDGIVLLHESAIARGARPHWLGQIGVRELGGVDAVATRFIELGATHLGPPTGVADFAIFRDPGGAIISVTDSTATSAAGVAWHQLNTYEPGHAARNYSALFGWSLNEEIDLGPLGRHRSFSFGTGETNAGAISDVEGRPGVHTHWLYFFAVPSVDVAIERVRAHGGIVIEPIELPNGTRVAVCDDPQGAAFGVIEGTSPTHHA